MENGASENKGRSQPWLMAVSIISGISWIANANFLQIIAIVERFLDTWRTILRHISQSLLDFISFPFDLNEYQLDAFSISSFLILSGLIRSVSGIRANPLFDKEYISRRLKATDDGLLSNLLSALIYIFSAIIYIIALRPFIDVDYFEAPTYILVNIVMITSSIILLYYISPSLIRIIKNMLDDKETRKENIRQFLIVIGAWLIIAILGYASSWLASQIAGHTGWNWLNSPILFRNIHDIDISSLIFSINIYIDMLLVIMLSFGLFIFTGKSIRPLFYMIVIGFSIMMIGYFGHIIVEIYNEYLI